MKMNDTVARIVEIMFQDVEMNEEVAAIRDEVMNNCQERYNDLVSSGVSDDNAIAAVIESLRGMEDVIAPYKRKRHHQAALEELDDDELEEEEFSNQDASFASYLVSKIDVTLVNEDVKIEPSDDDLYHVIWDKEENPLINVELHNDLLRIVRRPEDAVNTKKNCKVEMDFKDDMNDFVKTEAGKIEINMDSISRAMKSLGDKIKMQFSNGMNIRFGSAGGEVTVQVPENAVPHVKLLTTSGDIDVQDVALAALDITSTSGDINVALEEDQYVKEVQIRTTSGDIETSAFVHDMMIASTSGDVDVEGYYHNLSVNTISGDIDVRADVKNMTFKAVSGDVDMAFDSDEIREVRGSTISGDIDIDLPEGIGAIAIQTQTRSGDVTTRHHTNGVGPTVTGSVSSMSGDITIR